MLMQVKTCSVCNSCRYGLGRDSVATAASWRHQDNPCASAEHGLLKVFRGDALLLRLVATLCLKLCTE